MAGLTDTGFIALRLPEVRAEIEALWREAFGQNADLSPKTSDGQMVGIISERETALWEQLALVYAAGNSDSALGAALDEQLARAGLQRLDATSSTVLGTASGTPGTILPAGRQVRLDDSGTLWTLAGATIGAGGTVDVLATAVEVGPTVALSDPTSTWVIVTPVTGWTDFSNAEDAVPGRYRESHEAARRRLRRGFVGLGETADAIRAAISRVADVEEVIVANNTSMAADSEGRPPKSFEAIVRGGADDAIAQAIWGSQPDGIQAYSDSGDNGQALTATGAFATVPFTRPSEVKIWIEIDLVLDFKIINGVPVTKFPADGKTKVKLEIIKYEELLEIGEHVVPFNIIQGIETPGIKTAVIRIGRTAGPVDTVPVEMGSREIATLDSSRILVTTTP